MGYHSRQRRDWGRNGKVEGLITLVVAAIVVLTLVVFLFVYHDVPLRTP